MAPPLSARLLRLRLPVLLLLLLLLPLATTSSAPTSASASTPTSTRASVLELTPLTIDFHLDASSTRPLLLEFYAPWCSHCIAFSSSYRSVAATLSSTATVARVDGSLYKILSMRFRVRGFPSFFLIVDGQVFDFDERLRTAESLVTFVNARGNTAGKPHHYFFGPLGPYWKAVGAMFRALDAMYIAVRNAQLTPPQLAFVAVASLATLLLAFVAVIYVVTKPPRIGKTPVPHRPHAE